MGQIMGSANQVLKVKLKKKEKESGTLLIKVDKVVASQCVSWQWRGIKLMK